MFKIHPIHRPLQNGTYGRETKNVDPLFSMFTQIFFHHVIGQLLFAQPVQDHYHPSLWTSLIHTVETVEYVEYPYVEFQPLSSLWSTLNRYASIRRMIIRPHLRIFNRIIDNIIQHLVSSYLARFLPISLVAWCPLKYGNSSRYWSLELPYRKRLAICFTNSFIFTNSLSS